MNLLAAVRHNREISDSMSINHVVRHECVTSLASIALYTEMIIRIIVDKGGIKMGGTVINNIRYTEDTVIMAESKSQLQH